MSDPDDTLPPERSADTIPAPIEGDFSIDHYAVRRAALEPAPSSSALDFDGFASPDLDD